MAAAASREETHSSFLAGKEQRRFEAYLRSAQQEEEGGGAEPRRQDTEDAGWHSCDEKPPERSAPASLEQDNAANRLSDFPLPMTPPGSGRRLHLAPDQRSLQVPRPRGLRRPMTPSGFVKCWGDDKAMTTPASSSSSRTSTPLVRTRSSENLDDLAKALAQSMKDIAGLPPNACETELDIFRTFHRALTHAGMIFREVPPDSVLAGLEPKGITLHFVVDLHMRKRLYRRQTAAALAVLLQSDAWLLAVLQDPSLRAKMPEDLSASVPRRSLTAPPAPPSPRTPPGTAPGTPPQSLSPTRGAAVDADARDRAERRNRRATRQADQPIAKLLVDSAAQMEALGFSANGGDADEVVVAFNTFGRAVRLLRTTSQSEAQAAAAWLHDFEPKTSTLSFVADLAERRRHYRALAAQVLRRLCELESWRAASAALPKVQQYLSEAAQQVQQSLDEAAWQSPAASSDSLEQLEPCPKSYEELAHELDAAIRPMAPWYLRLFFGILGVIGTLRKCRCLVPRALQQQAEPLLDKVLSFSPPKESS